MKKIKSSWRKLEKFADMEVFRYRSQRIIGEGDKRLKPGAPQRKWKKIIILRPIGFRSVEFFMGFADVFGNVMVSTAKRTINDGFFGMRMGIEDCNFFIVSKNGLVDLMVEGYTDMLDPKYEYLNFY